MLIDCERAKEYIWSIDKLKSRRDSHKYHRDKISPELIADIDQRWNCLDGEGYDIQGHQRNFILLIWLHNHGNPLGFKESITSIQEKPYAAFYELKKGSY